MKAFIMILVFASFAANARVVICESSGEKMTINAQGTEIQVTYKGEITSADGLVSNEEVDIIAKFRSFGEMAIYAKIGKTSPENYLFFKGQKNPVTCR